jgi:hypothetical protein
MGKIFPEGYLFSNTFYGFSLINMAVAQPRDSDFSNMARSELERLIPLAEEAAVSPPFDENKNLSPQGGIIPAGHTNLLRADYCLLDGRKTEIIEKYHQQSAFLHELFLKSPVCSLETYSGII